MESVSYEEFMKYWNDDILLNIVGHSSEHSSVPFGDEKYLLLSDLPDSLKDLVEPFDFFWGKGGEFYRFKDASISSLIVYDLIVSQEREGLYSRLGNKGLVKSRFLEPALIPTLSNSIVPRLDIFGEPGEVQEVSIQNSLIFCLTLRNSVDGAWKNSLIERMYVVENNGDRNNFNERGHLGRIKDNESWDESRRIDLRDLYVDSNLQIRELHAPAHLYSILSSHVKK